MDNKNCDCKCSDYADKRLVEMNVSMLAGNYEELSFLDDVFIKINELEKEYKISCTPITININ